MMAGCGAVMWSSFLHGFTGMLYFFQQLGLLVRIKRLLFMELDAPNTAGTYKKL